MITNVTAQRERRVDREGISIPFPQQDLHFKLDPSTPAGPEPMEIDNSAATSQSAPDGDD